MTTRKLFDHIKLWLLCLRKGSEPWNMTTICSEIWICYENCPLITLVHWSTKITRMHTQQMITKQKWNRLHQSTWLLRVKVTKRFPGCASACSPSSWERQGPQRPQIYMNLNMDNFHKRPRFFTKVFLWSGPWNPSQFQQLPHHGWRKKTYSFIAVFVCRHDYDSTMTMTKTNMKW